MPRDYQFIHAVTSRHLLYDRFNDSWDVYATPCGKKVSLSQQPERYTNTPAKVTCLRCIAHANGTMHAHLSTVARGSARR